MRARMPLAVALLILVGPALVAPGRQAEADELLFNGDFSRGGDGWTPRYALRFDTDICSGHNADPAGHVYLETGGAGWLLSAAVPIEPGGAYEASGYAHFVPGGDPAPELNLSLVFYKSVDGGHDPFPPIPLAFLLPGTTDYTLITGSVTAPQQAHSARLRVELSASGATAACVDDLRFEGPPAAPTETPSPTVPAPLATSTPRPSPTVGPTATATEVPMPSESILNGGFEQGVEDAPAIWRKFGGFLSRSTSVARSGSFAGSFSSATTSTKWVFQPLAVEPGRSYAFHGFVLKNGPPDSLIFLRLSWYTSADASGSSFGTSDSPETLSGSDASYRYISTGSVTAPQEARSARARIVLVPASAAAEIIYLDDFVLEETAPPTPTPEPTATQMPSSTQTPAATSVPLGAEQEVASMANGRLMNGGFEQGVEDMPAVWRKFGGFLSRSMSFARSGSFAGSLSSSTTATKWVFQPLTIEPGRSYTFHGFVLKNGPPDSLVFLRLSWYASSDASGSLLASSDSPETLAGSDPSFRYLSTGSVTAPEEARSARARIVLMPASAAAEIIYLDDFALEETAPQAAVPTVPADDGPRPAEPSDGDAALSGEAILSSGRTTEARSPEVGRRSRDKDSPYAVKISEVVADAGRGANDASYEWVELYNASSDPVELAGWSLTDNVASDAVPSMVLGPRDYAVVAASADLQRRYPSLRDNLVVLADGRIGNGLANEGDRLLLLDEEGRPVDALSYGSDTEFFQPPAPTVSPGHSLERFPPDRDTDAAADFRDNAHPSPGQGPSSLPSPTATTDSPLSEVKGEALPAAEGGGPSWLWLLLVAGLVFVGGTGAGVAGVFLWFTRSSRA